MDERVYYGQDKLLKKPIEKIKKHKRLYHKLNKIKNDKEYKNLLNNNITIILYNENTHSIMKDFNLADILDENNKVKKGSEQIRDYLFLLPVIKKEFVYNRFETKSKQNSKKYLITNLDKVVFTVKYLPSTYVDNIFYKEGFIDDIIYDMIISKDKNQPAETVIGSESYDKMINYITDIIKTKKVCWINRMFNKYTKNELNIDENKMSDFLEYLFSKICNFDVNIYPTERIKNSSPEYYIIKKMLVKNVTNHDYL